MCRARCGAAVVAVWLLPLAAQAQDTLRLEEVLARAQRRGALVAQAQLSLDRAASDRMQGWRALLPQASAEAGSSWREGRPQIFNGVAFGAPSSTLGSSAGVQATLSLGAAGVAQVRANGRVARAAQLDVAAARAESRLLAGAAFFDAGLARAQAELQDSLAAFARLQLADATERLRLGVVAAYDVNRLRASLNAQEAAAEKAHAASDAALAALGVAIGRPLDATRVALAMPALPSLDAPAVRAPGTASAPSVRARASRLDALGAVARVERLAQWPTVQAFVSTSGFTNSFTDQQYVVAQTTAAAQSPCFEIARIRAAVGQSADPGACASVQPTAAELASSLAANRSFPWRLSRNPIVAGFTISLPLLDVVSLRRREESRFAMQQAAVDLVRARDEAAVREGSASATLTGAVRALRLLDSAVVLSRDAAVAVQERNRLGLAALGDVILARAEYERIARERLVAVADALRARFVLDELGTAPAPAR
jgi:outer membrane protein TolC